MILSRTEPSRSAARVVQGTGPIAEDRSCHCDAAGRCRGQRREPVRDRDDLTLAGKDGSAIEWPPWAAPDGGAPRARCRTFDHCCPRGSRRRGDTSEAAREAKRRLDSGEHPFASLRSIDGARSVLATRSQTRFFERTKRPGSSAPMCRSELGRLLACPPCADRDRDRRCSGAFVLPLASKSPDWLSMTPRVRLSGL